MDRIVHHPSSQWRRFVQPVERATPLKPLNAEDGGRSIQAPYGVVDRVTLSPEGRAMASRQRADRVIHTAKASLTYGPTKVLTPGTSLLPYTPTPE